MGQAYDRITGEMLAFVERQHVFFVATAPVEGGHVNVSPKGYDTFRVLDEHTVAYLDLTGSGTETAAHLRQNGRITFMFCAFEGDPVVVRFYGRGRVLTPGEAGFEDVRSRFGMFPGVRSVVIADVHRTSTSCGWAVPLMDYVGERTKLVDEYEEAGEAELAIYRERMNRRSIDELAAFEP